MAPHSRPFDPAVDAWEVLDRLIDDVDRRARAAPPPTLFWPELLRRAVDGLAAEGGVVWLCPAGRPVAAGRYEWGRPPAIADNMSPDAARLSAAAAAAETRRAGDAGSASPAEDAGGYPPGAGGLLVAPVV